MSVIILEGCDGTGKTTLAHDLQKRYGLSYLHVGPPARPEKAFSEYVEDVRQMAASPHAWICDRFHLGVYVYGHAYRKATDVYGDFDEREWNLLEDMLNDIGACLILCTPPFAVVEQVLKRKHASGEEIAFREYEDPGKTGLVGNLFTEAYGLSALPKTRYDYTNEDHSMKFLENFLWHLDWRELEQEAEVLV